MKIPTKYLFTLLHFAGKTDTRENLNAICLQIGLTESRLLASNGHKLGVFRISEGGAPGEWIIPRAAIEAISKKVKEVDITVEGDKVSITAGGNVSTWELVTGYQYPDVRRVVPATVSGEATQFNGNYLVDLNNAYKALHPRSDYTYPYILPNGSGAALVDLQHEDFIGAIMPLNLKADGAYPAKTSAWFTV